MQKDYKRKGVISEHSNFYDSVFSSVYCVKIQERRPNPSQDPLLVIFANSGGGFRGRRPELLFLWLYVMFAQEI